MSLGIFSVVPPTEPCALRSTQPLKVSTRDFFWGKGGRCVWLTTYHPCGAETSRKSGALTYPEPLGPPRPVAGDLYFVGSRGKIKCAIAVSPCPPQIPRNWIRTSTVRNRRLIAWNMTWRQLQWTATNIQEILDRSCQIYLKSVSFTRWTMWLMERHAVLLCVDFVHGTVGQKLQGMEVKIHDRCA